jgi:hypothetical protein
MILVRSWRSARSRYCSSSCLVALALASSNDRSAAYGGDAWTQIMWSDVNSSCHGTDTADCSVGDTSCEGGGGGCD